MTEKQLIAKIKELQQIKPSNDWVVLTKKQILGEEKLVPVFSFISFIREIQKGERFIFQHKPAFATFLVLAILFGLFGFAQNSVPGDTLFSVKKITEKSQTVFISEKGQPKHNLELTNKRLDDLTKIAEANQSQKLTSAINEYQESVSKAAESLVEAEVKEVVAEIKKLEEKTEKVKSLGIEIGESEEWDDALVKIVEREIEDLESGTLTEEQEEVLTEVKEDYGAENYSDALVKIWILSQ